jgi:hypothetical protein
MSSFGTTLGVIISGGFFMICLYVLLVTLSSVRISLNDILAFGLVVILVIISVTGMTISAKTFLQEIGILRYGVN